ncbi:MAG: hypothetical protein ABUS56_00535, partial [Acidobacteriota bacterium]
MTHGATWRLGVIRVAVRSPLRPFLWAAAVLVVRHLWSPRPPGYCWLVDWRQFGRSLRQPLAFEEVDLFGARRTWQQRASEFALLIAAFSVLVAALTWPQVRHLDFVSDLGDPLFSIWRLDWVSHQIIRHPLALFDANIFYPERFTLTYSDAVIVPALMSAPLFWLGVHPVVVYNLLLLSGFVLSGVAMFLMVRALTGRVEAAAVAGAIFAVYPYRYEHYSHLELQMTMWAPLALWMLHRTLARGRLA